MLRAAALASIALLSLACSGVLYQSPSTVRSDVEQHLQHTYAQRFVVTRVSNRSNEGVGIVDVHDWSAHPVDAPGQVVSGSASYEVTPPRFEDDFRCLRAKPSALKRWRGALLERGLLPRRDELRCTNDALPVHPATDGTYPEAFRYRGDVYVFSEGEPSELADQAMTEVLAAGAVAGVEPKPFAFHFFPAELSQVADRISEEDTLLGYRRAYLTRTAQGDWKVQTQVRLPSLERALRVQLEAAVDGQMEVLVWARSPEARALAAQQPEAEPSAFGNHALGVDVRLATSNLDAADVLAARLREELPEQSWWVHAGRYPDPTNPTPSTYEEGRVCTALPRRCVSVANHLVAPRSR